MSFLIFLIVFWILIAVGIQCLLIFLGYLYMPRFIEKVLAPGFNASFKRKLKIIKNVAEEIPQDLPPKFQFDEHSGEYSIQFGAGRSLSNGVVKIHCRGVWYSSQPNPRRKEQPLSLLKVQRGKQSTPLGEMSKITQEWQCGSNGVRFRTSVLIPEGKAYLIFEQEFPEEISGTATKKFKIPIVSFPCFINDSPNKNILAFQNRAFCFPTNKLTDTSGPVLFYDDHLNGFLLSPMNNFLIGMTSQLEQINCGIAGEVESIPKDFTYKTIMCFGQGVHAIFEEWGNLLRQWYGAERRSPYFDDILSYIGYWTDNGAHYYYRTIPGLNYHETYVKIHEYVQEAEIPFGYYQFDSWWYPKANAWLRRPLNLIFLKGGAIVWEPMKEMFPDGFEALQQVLQKPITCHGRWFAINSPYLKEYEFWTSTNLINKWAVPKSSKFWIDIFGKTKGWNLQMYEQDWLSNMFKTVKDLRTDVEAARTYLLNLNKGAAAYDMSIQLCMGSPGFWLHSLEMDRVTNVRSGADYNARFPKTFMLVPQTQNALFFTALGLWPSIDVMCTSPGPKRFYKEKHADLQVLFANLTGGILGVGDPIGYVNKPLLMLTCRSDGLMLKPDRPIVAIDLMFKPHSKYYICSTYSKKEDYFWDYVLVVNYWPNRVKEKTFTLRDLGLNGSRVVFDFINGNLRKLTGDEAISLDLKKNQFGYFILAPIKNGTALIGTPDKFITCSNIFIPTVRWTASAMEFEVDHNSLVSNTLLLYAESKPKKIEINAGLELGELEKDFTTKGEKSGWFYQSSDFNLTIKTPDDLGDHLKIKVLF